jgi:hypothetical protein
MPNHPAFSRWQTLENQIEALQRLHQGDAVDAATPPPYLPLLEQLHQQIQGQMTQSSEHLVLPGVTQRHITELHRLVRLSLTDAALLQNARSVDLRKQRLEQLGDRMTLLREHAHAIVMALTDESQKGN